MECDKREQRERADAGGGLVCAMCVYQKPNEYVSYTCVQVKLSYTVFALPFLFPIRERFLVLSISDLAHLARSIFESSEGSITPNPHQPLLSPCILLAHVVGGVAVPFSGVREKEGERGRERERREKE